MRIIINIQVNYDGATVDSRDALERALEKGLERFIGDGGFTPSGDEIVDDYLIDISKPGE